MFNRLFSVLVAFATLLSSISTSSNSDINYQQLESSISPELAVSPLGISPVSISKNLENLTTITGAYYEPINQELVIIGISEPGLPNLKLDDFVAALRAMYSNNYPAVSIDPSENPDAMDVSYWGDTEGTHFGYVMFEADRLLKTLSMGTDNVTGKSVSPQIDGFQTYLQLSTSNYSESEQSEAWFRMWFEPQDVEVLTSPDRKSMTLQTPSMIVKTEYLPPNYGSDANAEAFVEHINQNYEAYASNYPILFELKQLEQWLLVAKWMRDNNIPIDLSFLGASSSSIYDTPAKTPTITVEKTFVSGDYLVSLSLYGGVDFRIPKDNYKVSETAIDPITANLKANRPDTSSITWETEMDSVLYRAIAMSPVRISRAGSFARTEIDLGAGSTTRMRFVRYYDSFSITPGSLAYGWKPMPYELNYPNAADMYDGHPRQILIKDNISHALNIFTLSIDSATNELVYHPSSNGASSLTVNKDGSYSWLTKNGITTKFDAFGKLISVIDTSGIKLEYVYTEDGKLDKIQNGSGEQISIEYNKEGQIVRAYSADEEAKYSYNNTGELESVTNSNGYARKYNYNSSHRIITVLDEAGNTLVENEFDDLGRIKTQTLGGQTYIMEYGSANDGTLKITNQDDPNNYRNYKYDDSGRLTSIDQTERPSITYTYENADLFPNNFEIGNEKFRATYDGNGNLEKVIAPSIGETVFNHTPTGSISSLINPDGSITNFERDSNGALRRLVTNLDQPDNVILFNRSAEGHLESVSFPNGETRSLAPMKDIAVEVNKPAFAMLNIDNRMILGVLTYPDGLIREIELTEDNFIKSVLFTDPELLLLSDLTLAEKIERTPEMLAGYVGSLVSTNSVVVMNGDLNNVNYNKVFSNQSVIRLRSQDIDRSARNIKLNEETVLSPANTVIINGTPQNSKEVGAIGLLDDPSVWDGINTQWVQSSKKHGYITQTGASAFTEALQNSSNVIVVVAHADGNTIFWPDGTSTTAQDINNLSAEIKKNQPLVLLFSCQTARFDGTPDNIVDALLDAGARGVMGPTTDIEANEKSLGFFRQVLLRSSNGRNILDALKGSEIYINYDLFEFWVRILNTIG